MYHGTYEVLATDDGSLTLRNQKLNEEFHSVMGARSEARHLYIEGSSIREMLKNSPVVRVLDVGLGLGYNALETIKIWDQEGTGDLEIVSLEHDRFLVTQLASGNPIWKGTTGRELDDYARALEPAGSHMMRADIKKHGKRLIWKVAIGDARLHQFKADEFFDYIWQDPFSPLKQPNMWSVNWFRRLKSRSLPHTELLTYSVARVVRDNLQASQWSIEKIPGAGQKKHWLKAFATNPLLGQ